MKEVVQKGGICSLLYIALLASVPLIGQVEAPHFQCVRGDTLFWELPINTCGTFNAYQVYASQTAAGPYTNLAVIEDAAAVNYVHPSGSNATWYYYLESDYNCPNEQVLQSDTINNRLPEVAPIETISVDGNAVNLSWYPSPSPEVIGYTVYRIQASGTIPIADVGLATNYTDLDASPTTQAEAYHILAYDACDKTSIFDAPHRSVFLSAIVDSCTQSILLSWNAYEGWANDISHHQVWVGENGETPALLADNIADNSFRIPDVKRQNDYCIYIQTIEETTSVIARSNQTCVRPTVVNANNDLILLVADIKDDEVELDWRWNTDADLNMYVVERSEDGIDYTTIQSDQIAPPLLVQFQFTDRPTAIGQPYYYRIGTRDDCQKRVNSNYLRTILLSSEARADSILLNWTNFETDLPGTWSYILYQIINGNQEILGTFSNQQTQFSILRDSELRSNDQCYLLQANALLQLATGEEIPIQQFSNETCIQQIAEVILPNALAPHGRNQEFKPVFLFGSVSDYQLQIFDRWGKVVFMSNDLDIAWRGRNQNGRDLPAGTYVYNLSFRQANQQLQTEHGTVFLMR